MSGVERLSGDEFGVVRSTTVPDGFSISIVIASSDEVEGIFIQVEECSRGLSSEPSTRLVKIRSPSSNGGFMDRMCLMLCLTWWSDNFHGGVDFMGEDAFLLTIRVGFGLEEPRIGIGLVLWFSESILLGFSGTLLFGFEIKFCGWVASFWLLHSCCMSSVSSWLSGWMMGGIMDCSEFAVGIFGWTKACGGTWSLTGSGSSFCGTSILISAESWAAETCTFSRFIRVNGLRFF